MTAARTGYYRFPTIHRDRLAFVCEDDLWLVDLRADGSPTGPARRISANPGEPVRPALSPDGAWIAFTSRDEGQTEIFVMPASGGPAKRLTYLGANTLVIGWDPHTPDHVLFVSDAGQPFAGQYHVHRVSREGGPCERLPYGPAMDAAFESGGKGVVISRLGGGRGQGDPAKWKRYRGGRAGTLWIDRRGNGEFAPLIQLEGDLASPMWIGERIYFLSDHEGMGNVYSCTPEGANLRRESANTEYYVRFPRTDGERIVWFCGGDLYLYDLSADAPEPHLLEVETPSTRPQRSRKFVDTASYLESYALHPRGHELAITTRGKPFTFALWEDAVMQHGDPSGRVRYRLAQWLASGDSIVAVADEDGEDERLVRFDMDGRVKRIGGARSKIDIGRAVALCPAPRPGDPRVILGNHRYELMLVDLDKATAKIIDRSPVDRISSFTWSPDGRWIVYSFAVDEHAVQLRAWDTKRNEMHEMTSRDFRDVEPRFDPKGDYLYFFSYREYDPVYDNHLFDLGFPRGMRLLAIPLRRDLPDPFRPTPRPPGAPPTSDAGPDPEESRGSRGRTNRDRATDHNDEEDEGAQTQRAGSPSPPRETAARGGQKKLSAGPREGAAKKAAIRKANAGSSAKQAAPPAVEIEFDDIQRRIVACPISEGRFGMLRVIPGKLLFTTFPIEGSLGQSWANDGPPPARGMLELWDFNEQKRDLLIPNVSNFEVSGDLKTLAYRAQNRLRVLPAGRKLQAAVSVKGSASEQPGRASGWIDLNRVRPMVDPPSEWAQMFDEAWRLQRDQFWVADMSGVDWEHVRERYRPLIDRIASRSEFSDLMWEMQGELGTSHAYEIGGDYRPSPRYIQGFLGADLRYDERLQCWRIERIPQGDSWQMSSASPLRAPGVNIREGDRLLAVNFQEVGAAISPGEMLVNRANQDVKIEVADSRGRNRRTVTVRTLSQEFSLRYRDWIERNRAFVHEQSRGRLGYVHIPDMGPNGYAEFHRLYLPELRHPGLIVDVRFNRGGHVSQLILEKLVRKRIGYNVNRWGEPLSYPGDSVLGPIIGITNEYAGSDGDIFSHCFKLLKIGPLFGKRTWGGVVGIWPRHRLVDGSVTTQPEFSFWFNDVGFQVENYGTDPDIEVEITPQDHARGHDPQLERAVREGIERIDADPPTVPDFGPLPLRPLPDRASTAQPSTRRATTTPSSTRNRSKPAKGTAATPTKRRVNPQPKKKKKRP